jgi:TolB-like protein/tetratricopeptide (TPR) repeat protein
VLAAHVTQAPDPVGNRRPGIPAGLDAVIMRCLAKRPADRWQTAGELHGALEVFGTPSSGITPTQSRPTTATSGNRRLLWVAAAAIVLLAAFGFWRFRGAGTGSSAAQAIAVLPFENMTRDTAVDYLADGIANDVRSGLMSLPGLIVKARTSSEAARGKPVHDAGAMLKVGVILQGTYRHAADKTTVTVDLVNVADEAALWTGNFTLPADGNFSSAQDSITAAVSQALHLVSASGSGSAAEQRGTRDMEAYDNYLKGQFFFAKRGGENLQRAVDYFQRAIARDGQFARAKAGLAMVYSILPGYLQVGGTDSLGPAAERIARQALAIDSTLVDGHVALANALVALARPLEAVAEFRKALALDPRDATAHQWLGDALNLLGQSDEAIREGRAAVELDPLSAVAGNDLVYTLVCAGKFDEALVESHRVRELDARFAFVDFYMGEAYAFLQKTDSAVAALERFYQLDSLAPQARAMHVWRFAVVGNWPAAEGELKAIDRTITGGSREIDMAAAALVLGNREAALAGLEREGAKRSYYLAVVALGCDPLLFPLRSEPRFIAVVKQMGQGMCTNTVRWPIPVRPGGKL